jgi:hypothetical protein
MEQRLKVNDTVKPWYLEKTFVHHKPLTDWTCIKAGLHGESLVTKSLQVLKQQAGRLCSGSTCLL